MTEDMPREATDGTTTRAGEYRRKEDIKGSHEPCRPSTGEGDSRGNRVRKVNIGTQSGLSSRSVKIAVDVIAEDRQGKIADLNARLKRLRCSK